MAACKSQESAIVKDNYLAQTDADPDLLTICGLHCSALTVRGLLLTATAAYSERKLGIIKREREREGRGREGEGSHGRKEGGCTSPRALACNLRAALRQDELTSLLAAEHRHDPAARQCSRCSTRSVTPCVGPVTEVRPHTVSL